MPYTALTPFFGMISDATYPAGLAQGMDWVFVNGVPAIADGAFTGSASGRFI